MIRGAKISKTILAGSRLPLFRYFSDLSPKTNKDESAPGEVKLSDNCVKRLKSVCEGTGSFLRLSVEGGGCSGFQYKFDLDDKMQSDDIVFERDGGKLVVDSTSLEYVNGSMVDYKSELIRSAFTVVENPNASQGCSCGASFTINV